jgi:GTP 3',8-cyclase
MVSAMLLDQRQRPLRDLRLSVTDRCNFRCPYCMPRTQFGPGFRFLPQPELLSFEELARLTQVFVNQGVQKLRITGGEPLLRRDLHKLIALMPRAPGLDVALTTNGSRLALHAAALRAAGLARVTVSLDALEAAVFERMADSPVPVSEVLSGIETAQRVGLGVKINTVVQRGVNEDQVLPLVRYCRERRLPLRLIEFMDVGATNGWQLAQVVPARELFARIHAEFPLAPLTASYRGEVAQRYAYADGGGELGLIASVTEPFCGDCTRARVSAQGRFYTCLFASEGTDLRQMLRNGASDAELNSTIQAIWQARRDAYSEQRGAPQLLQLRRSPRIEMSYIGG